MTRENWSLMKDKYEEDNLLRTKIKVQNFAKIEHAEIYLDDLVLFVGDNNSGKTLLMELIYGIIQFIQNWKADCSVVKMMEAEYVKYIRFDQKWYLDVENKINSYLKEHKNQFVVDTFKTLIPLDCVSVHFEEYEDSFYIATVSETINLEKQASNGNREIIFENMQTPDDWMNMLAQRILTDILGMNTGEKQLFVPAARAGLQMLYRYLFAETTSENAGFPLPVAEFLKYIQTYALAGALTSDESDLLSFIENRLLNGKVAYENGQFLFYEKESAIPLNYASSMIHELSILPNILKSIQRIGYVYYDEVENSVHPLLQGIVAQTLIRFCNLGRKMLISTHSDTMAGRLNNIILLSKMKNIAERNKKIEKIGLSNKDLLDEQKNVTVYEFVKTRDGHVTVENLEFMSYPKIGYEFERFNENIEQLYDESTSIMEDE